MSSQRVPMSCLTKIQLIWFSRLNSHSKHINEQRALFNWLQLYSYLVIIIFWTFVLFFIEFKFKLSFSFSKMAFTTSSLKTNYLTKQNNKCPFFINNFFSASFVWRRDKVVLALYLCTISKRPNVLNLQFKLICPHLDFFLCKVSSRNWRLPSIYRVSQ